MQMKTNKLFGSLVAVFMAVVLFVPGQALAAAFGVSPPWVENDNIKPGASFVYIINLSANDLPQNMSVSATYEGNPELEKWLTIQNQDNLVMTTGKNIVPMSINVHVPEDAQPGKYEGNMKLSLISASNQMNSITTLLGGNVTIKLNVVNHDVTEYKVREISVNPIIEGQPITLSMTIQNLGNTEIASVKTKASVLDKKSNAVIFSGAVNQLNVTVQPQTKTTTKLTLPVPGLQAGDYWLDVEAAENNGNVYKNRLHMTVTPKLSNNIVSTGVTVTPEGWIKPVAMNDMFKSGQNANVETSVKVRAPLTNQLIMVIIGILLVLTGIVGKFYLTFKKKRH
jgi:hypothetical protein